MCFFLSVVFSTVPLGLLVTVLVTLLVTIMKLQTGVRVEAEVWRAYRALCSRERLRPSLPVEEFLRLVLENGSALGFLSVVHGAAKTRVEGVDAYARVLLDWYTHGKRFFHAVGEDEAPVEGLLLEALKAVTDSKLRQRISRGTYCHTTVAVP